MKIDFAVCCDYAVVDRLGKLSVLGIFHHIWVARFPAIHPRLHLVIRLRGHRTEIGDHPIRIRLVNEHSDEILSGQGTVTFAEPPAGVLEIEAGAVLVFDVPFQSAGGYRFEIAIDNQIHTDIPITVAEGSPGPPGSPTAPMMN